MGISDTAMQQLTVRGLTVGYHRPRRRWMLLRTRGDRREVVAYYRDRLALQEAVLRLVAER